jgi:broad specificity phosphatase PhoE
MLIVVRHGRTTANAEGRLQGRLDLGLDETGVEQARAVAAWIGRVDRVVTSPLARARETAEAFGVDVEVDERWIELDYGELDGKLMEEISPAVWDRLRTDPDWTPEGGESLTALHGRVVAACEELAAMAATADVVVVTHVSPIKSVLSWTLGGAPGVPLRTRVTQPSVTRVGFGPAGPVLHGFNLAPPVP